MPVSHQRLRTVLLIALATLTLLVPTVSRPATAHAAAHAAATPGAVGVQWHAVWSSYDDTERMQVLDALKAAGVQWVRMDIGWDMIEGQAPGSRDAYWTGRVDSYVDMAVARGLKPLVTLYQTPAWARPAGTTNRTPPSDPATYASFARWAAARWAGRVAAWEVWNEPNLEEFWVGTDPVRYAQLLTAAYPAFKAGDPATTVVAGAASYNDDAWLRRMYAGGAAGSFDVLSTHPYQGPADGAPETPDDGNPWHLTHVPAVRDLMVSHGDGAKPIWFTELGWSTHHNTGSEQPWQRGVSEQQQADFIVRAMQHTRSAYPYVTNIFLYNERDRTDADVQNNNYGLLRADLTPKPAYAALKAYLLAVATPAASVSPAPSAPTPTSSPTSPPTGQAPGTPAPVGPLPTATAPSPTAARPANLLQGMQATFDGGTAGWSTASLHARLRYRAAPLGLTGGAGELVGTASGAKANLVAVRSDARRSPVTAGTTYTARISARARTTSRHVTIFLNWFSATGTYLGQASATATDAPTSWTELVVRAVAPRAATTASITVQVQRPAAGEPHLLDQAGLFADPAAP